jgi:selenide,water dikinase
MQLRTPRLTELANLAGCTAKASPELLSYVLDSLDPFELDDEPSELLVGLRTPDDAAVYRLADGRALVVTVDFFAPIVDDPFAYGAIAAANALSDVYAMGGEPAFVLNVAAFPIDLPRETVSAIVRGGSRKVREAGAFVVGGHTVIDLEPKFGLCAVGFADPDRLFTKAGLNPGDRMYLTKPLGTGVITTAAKFEEAEPEHIDAATESMSRLNGPAARLAQALEVHALTDVTGFGLLGHAVEMARASDAGMRLHGGALPLLPGALEYAARGVITGGGFRNRESLVEDVRVDPGVAPELDHLLYDPQTSGGLLFAAPQSCAAEVESRFAEAALPLWCIGEVVAAPGVAVAA